jgi:hypothetical protein
MNKKNLLIAILIILVVGLTIALVLMKQSEKESIKSITSFYEATQYSMNYSEYFSGRYAKEINFSVRGSAHQDFQADERCATLAQIKGLSSLADDDQWFCKIEYVKGYDELLTYEDGTPVEPPEYYTVNEIGCRCWVGVNATCCRPGQNTGPDEKVNLN